MHFSTGDLQVTDDLRLISYQQTIGWLVEWMVSLREKLSRTWLVVNALQERQDRWVIPRIGRSQREAKFLEIRIERGERVVATSQLGECARTSAHDGGCHH